MSVGKESIDRLRLDEAFAGKIAHLPIADCICVKCDERLLVVDDDETKCSRFVNEGDDINKALMIVNEKKREIVLLSVDNKLLKGIQGGIADCAIFDDKQFRFVEFKTNAEGKNNRAIQNTFDKAVGQLKNTIQVFRDRLQAVDVKFDDAVVLSCHIVLSHNFPRSMATTQNYQYEFATDTGGIMLSFDSETYWEKPER